MEAIYRLSDVTRNMMQAKASEYIIDVSLFLSLWATRFLRRRPFMLVFSQNKNILLKSHSRMPCKLKARILSPTIRPTKIRKNIFSSNEKS
jgi:hypothetical protein